MGKYKVTYKVLFYTVNLSHLRLLVVTIFFGLVHMDSQGFCKPAGRMHGSNAVVDNLSFCLAERPERARRFSMENMEIMKLTPDKKVRSVLIVFYSHDHYLRKICFNSLS